MATRLYYTQTVSPLVPAFDAEWDLTTSAATCLLTRTPRATLFANLSLTKGTDNMLDKDRLMRQYISPPLAAQTISGTAKGRLLCSESAAGNNIRSQMIIRACNGSGTAFTGALYAGDLTTLTGDPTSEWNLTSKVNRQMPRGSSVSLDSLAVNDGDRIVIGVGYRVHTTSASNFNGQVIFGDAGVGDLPEDESSTDTTLRAWIEFSQDLLWADERCRAITEWEA